MSKTDKKSTNPIQDIFKHILITIRREARVGKAGVIGFNNVNVLLFRQIHREKSKLKQFNNSPI